MHHSLSSHLTLNNLRFFTDKRCLLTIINESVNALSAWKQLSSAVFLYSISFHARMNRTMASKL
jgi:hypothetical protein